MSCGDAVVVVLLIIAAEGIIHHLIDLRRRK